MKQLLLCIKIMCLTALVTGCAPLGEHQDLLDLKG